MRHAIVLSFVIAACDSDSGGGPPPPDPSVVRIGLIAALSGPQAYLGLDMQNSARLAITEINAAGGINGKPVELLARDSKTAQDEAEETSVAAVEWLAAAGVVATVGPDASALVVAVMDTAKAHGMPLVSASASAANLSTFADDGLFFRTTPSDRLQGGALADRIQRDGRTSLAIIHRDDVYGTGLADGVASAFEAGGGQVLAVVPFPDSKTTDFGPEVEAAVAAGTPDAIVIIGFALDSAGVLTAIFADLTAPRPALYGCDGNRDPALVGNAPEEVLVGMRFSSPVSRTDQPGYMHFDTIYRDTLDAEPFGGEFTYDAVYLLALALIAGGENSSAAVRDHLGPISRPDGEGAVVIGVGEGEIGKAVQNRTGDLDFHGASGAIDFDGSGDITATTYAIQEIRRGKDGLDFVDLELIDLPE
jgi:branched-chain amino acid transport system substrate-binding protein